MKQKRLFIGGIADGDFVHVDAGVEECQIPVLDKLPGFGAQVYHQHRFVYAGGVEVIPVFVLDGENLEEASARAKAILDKLPLKEKREAGAEWYVLRRDRDEPSAHVVLKSPARDSIYHAIEEA